MIHLRGIESADIYTAIVANGLTVNGQYVTFLDAEGRPWKTELSEVSGISITDVA